MSTNYAFATSPLDRRYQLVGLIDPDTGLPYKAGGGGTDELPTDQTLVVSTSDGAIPSGIKGYSVLASVDFSGTFDGQAVGPGFNVSVSFSELSRAIPYTITSGTLTVITTA